MQAPLSTSTFMAHLEGSFAEASTPTSDFAGRLLDLINGGALAVMISVGHRAGLFDALAEHPGLSLDALVERTGFDAHELRAWLDAMIVGGLIEQDPDAETLALPDAHAASLCRASGPDNLAVLAQYVGLLGRAEDELLAKLRGPGSAASGDAKGRARAIASEELERAVLPAIDAELLPLIPEVVDRMRLGADILELGCGRGRALIELAARFPRSHFVGVDSSPEALAEARAEARARELDNVEFCHGDDPSRCYDLILELAPARHAGPCPDFAAIALAPEGVYLQRHSVCSGQAKHDRGLALAPLLYARACVDRRSSPAVLRAALEARFASVEQHQLEYEPWDEYFVCRAPKLKR